MKRDKVLELDKILVDTREQKPLSFSRSIEIEKMALKYGDYTRERGKTICVVEWKSFSDWAGCNWSESSKARLDKQLKKMIDNVERPMLLVEAAPSDISLRRIGPFKNARPGFRERLLEIADDWTEHLPVVVVPNRIEAAERVMRWLRRQGR